MLPIYIKKKNRTSYNRGPLYCQRKLCIRRKEPQQALLSLKVFKPLFAVSSGFSWKQIKNKVCDAFNLRIKLISIYQGTQEFKPEDLAQI